MNWRATEGHSFAPITIWKATVKRIENRRSRIEDRISAHKSIFDPRFSILNPRLQVGLAGSRPCPYAFEPEPAHCRAGETFSNSDSDSISKSLSNSVLIVR